MSDPWQPYLWIVGVLWLAAMAQAALSLWDGITFHRFMKKALQQRLDAVYQPPATVILPCCGVDDELRQTVDMLGAQRYRDYDVIFTFESQADPAYEAVGAWAAKWSGVRWKRVMAGPAEGRSQKVHNLLAAVAAVDEGREVLAFIDSDAIPHPDWLAWLVAPLRDPHVGAGTGFRWYRAAGGWTSGLRSAWNAASVSFLHNPAVNFCWGGSTAIRTKTFRDCGVAERWRTALSDDYQLTRAVRDAGLELRFVPQCLISCEEQMGFAQFVAFARRQLVITRICNPRLWREALALATLLVFGASGTFVLMIVAALAQRWTLAAVTCAAWLLLLSTARAKALVRQSAVSMFLQPPKWTNRDWAHDVLGVEVVGVVHLFLLLSTAVTRRVRWRDRDYVLLSADKTLVLPRNK